MKKYCNLNIKLVTITILLSLLFAVNSYSQQHWRKISRATTQNLWKCSFIDTLNGWAVGDSGTIVHTTNGGYNWNEQNSKIREYMVNVFFLNKRLGWALAWGLNQNFYGTYILKTTNGGNVWDTTRYPVPDTYIRSIYFQDSLYGFMTGPQSIQRTTNGGINWIPCAMDTSVIGAKFPVSRFRFFSNNYGIACGGVMDIAGLIWLTTNRGLYWSVTIVAPEPVNDVHFFDSLNILGIAGDFEYGASILNTTNGGQNWTYKNMGFFGIPYVLEFRTASEGWAPMGYMKQFINTTDAGTSWMIKNTPDSTGIFDMTFKSSNFGIGVGMNGYVIKYFSCPTFSVSGIVRYNDNNQPVTTGMVKAFQLDKSSGNVVYLDSAQIQSDGSYTLANVPQDSLDIGVFPNSVPPNDMVITYYPSTIYWQEATVLYPTEDLNGIDIRAIRLVSTRANNSLNGRVFRSVNSLSENLKDAFMYVKNGNTFVKCSITDENGVYRMQSLPVGNLKVIVNRLGFTSDSTNVNVTATSNIDSVNFYLHKLYIGIKQISSSIPSDYKLFQNYPNPFNPSTVIRFQIKDSRTVTLKVYDLLGREVATLVNEKLQSGEYEIPFNVFQLAYKQISSGIYLYRLQAGDYSETKRMVLLK